MVPVLLIAGTACSSRHGMGDVPPQLRGRWRTADARYLDRAFELQARSVIFDTGNDTFFVRQVVSVDSIVERGLVHFRLLYAAGGSVPFHFDFSYDPAQEVIRLRNQPEIVWHRVSPESPGGAPRDSHPPVAGARRGPRA